MFDYKETKKQKDPDDRLYRMFWSVSSSQLPSDQSHFHIIHMFVTESAARLYEVVVSGQVTGAMTSELGRLAQQLLMLRLLVVAAAGLVAPSVSISSLFASSTATTSLWVGGLCVSDPCVLSLESETDSRPPQRLFTISRLKSSHPLQHTSCVASPLLPPCENIFKKKKKKQPSVATLTFISVEVNVRF